jgi:hypothetical protein
MSGDEDFRMNYGDDALHKLYKAAIEPEYWQDAASAISELMGGGAVHLLLASLDTNYEYVNLFSRDETAFAEEYIRDYAAFDFRVPRVMARPLGAFADEREYVSPNDARASPIHRELLPRYDIHNISGANLCLDGCIGWFGISTSGPAVEFDNQQRSYLTQLSRHILTACRISRTHQDLQITCEQSLSSLDLFQAGFFLLNAGRVVHANDAAIKLIDDGFFMLRNDQLSCRAAAARRKLASFLAQTSEQRSGPLLLRQHEREAAYLVSLNDLFARYGGDGRVAWSGYQAITITELNIPSRIDLDEVLSFCSAYGVTPAEAMTVHASLNSVSLSSFTEARGIGINTARQQLKSALAKMDLNSQKKLFRAFERHRLVARR